jgi:hypothetical protein
MRAMPDFARNAEQADASVVTPNRFIAVLAKPTGTLVPPSVHKRKKRPERPTNRRSDRSHQKPLASRVSLVDMRSPEVVPWRIPAISN